MYEDKEIEDDIINSILENANWAPTHRKTEPWRFKVIKGKKLAELGVFLSEYYQKNTPAEDFSPVKYNKSIKKTKKSAAVIAICMARDPNESVPEWEEIAATAMAVQNMWLCCTELGIGSYWSSPALIKYMDEFFDVSEGEKCLGFFYMGYTDDALTEVARKPIEDKVVWMD